MRRSRIGDADQLLLDPVEEAVQPAGHQRVEPLGRQLAAHAVDQLERFAAAAQAMALAQAMQQLVDFADAQPHRAGKLAVIEQESHHLGRDHAARMDPAEGLVARRRAQKLGPAAGLERRHALVARHGAAEADIEQAGGLVGALEIAAELVEGPALVAEEGALGDAGMGLAGLLDGGAQPRQVGRAHRLGGQLLQPVVEHVELRPHLDADQRAQHAGIVACRPHGEADRGRIGGIREIEGGHRGGVGDGVAREEAILVGVDLNHRQPVVTIAAVAGVAVVDVEQAGEVFRPLDVAGHPEQAVGVAGEQARQGPRYPSTRRPARS